MTKGWRNESHRHSLSARGIKTVPRKNFMGSRGVPSSRFFKFYTNIPMYDEILDNPVYFREQKGYTGEIVWMSPDEYIEAVDKGFRGTMSSDEVKRVEDRIIPKYVETAKAVMLELEDEGKVAMPLLDYGFRNGFRGIRPDFNQDGHHRAVASKLLGEELIPVFVKYPSDKEKFGIVMNYITPKVWSLIR